MRVQRIAASNNTLRGRSLSTSCSVFNLSPGKQETLLVQPRALYLDMQATTPVDPRVLDVMIPLEVENYGNAHSRTHSYGWENEAVVENARKQVADLIGAEPADVIFTSGATESNNLALKGYMHFYKGKKTHLITTAIEHKCVLDSCRTLEQEGFTVTYLPVNNNGVVDLKRLEEAIRPETGLVSIMAVNNEIGVLQPLKEIGEICKKHKVDFHTDAAQMVGKLPVNVKDINCSLMSISGHKIYGPKGVGALYVRRRPRIRLDPIISGGGQERNMRSGTLPVPLAAGLGKACEVAMKELDADQAHVKKLFHRMYDRLKAELPDIYLNGDEDMRYHGNLNISFAYVEGESLLMACKNVALSSGSACTSASLEPSYVLRALGVEEDMAHTSIRFGLGRFTTEEEVDYTTDLVIRSVRRLRDLSPLWEMAQEGIDLKSIQWSQH